MQLFRFDAAVAKRSIHEFGSAHVAISGILRNVEAAHIGCLHFGALGRLGSHPAAMPQLFLVIQGAGWVQAGASSERQTITAGQAAFWESGEEHESGTDTGMTALVIEGKYLDPAAFMVSF